MNSSAALDGAQVLEPGCNRARKAHATLARRLLCAIDALPIVWIAVFGAAIVVLVAMPLAQTLNIWIDEAFTLHTTGAGPVVAWTQAIAFEDQPPLYFVLEAAWRTWNEGSIWFARVPSVAFAAATVAVTVAAAHRMAPRIPPIGVALAAALNPFIIWAAVEMRVYALVLLIGAVLTWTFLAGFLSAQPSRRARLWYVLFAIAGLYTQFYVGFLLAAHAVTLMAVRRRAVRDFCVAGAIVVVAFVPFVRVALTDVGASGQFVLRTTLFRAAHEVANAVFVMVLPHDLAWSGVGKAAGFAIALALLTGLCAIGRPSVARDPAAAVVLAWAIGLTVFALAFTIAGAPLVSFKYLAVLAPSSLLAAVLLLSSLQRHRAPLIGIALFSYAVFSTTTLWHQYRTPLPKPGDWQRVAAAVRADQGTTPIAVFPAELAEPLGWYLHAAPISIPRPMPFSVDYVRAITLTGEPEVARVLDRVGARSERLWLVTTDDCPASTLDYYNYHCRFLEHYVQQRYRVARTIAFRGALARLYVRDPKESVRLHVRQHAN